LLPLFEDGCEMRTVEEPLGYKDVQTTPNCTHLLKRGVRASLDRLWKRVCGETLVIMPTGRCAQNY
jgi:hypothetical protein